jgi:L-aminopeptidase/D-esterase-like protein
MNRATIALITLTATTAFAGGSITDVPGIKVGSVTLTDKPTGCTVILADGELTAQGVVQGATPGVSQRGGAPGTRETDLMDPLNLVDKANAIVLSGGSAYGLDAASGTMKWLEERNIGWPVGPSGVVPIVGSAILFDLPFDGKPKIRPGADCGYKASALATTDPVVMGTVGAGAGATVGKAGGPERRPMKGGLGSASLRMPNGLVVGAIVAVNSVGDIVDPYTGKVVAGSINADDTFADVRQLIRSGALMQPRPRAGENTTIGVVATNARMTKAEVTKMAQMADDGYARAINPAHTMGDGDTIFALATGRWDGEANPTLIGALAAEVMADALLAAVREATGAGGVKAVRDLKPSLAK